MAENEQLTGHIHFSPEDTPDNEIYLRSRIMPADIQRIHTLAKELGQFIGEYRDDMGLAGINVDWFTKHPAEWGWFMEDLERVVKDSEKGQGG